MLTPRRQILAATENMRVKFAPRWDDTEIAGKGVFDPRYILMHHTAGIDSLAWLRSGCDHKPVPGSHFLVSRDGTVHVLTRFLAYHAGKGGPYKEVDAGMMNHYSWGIEIESLGLKKDLPKVQLEAAAHLAAGLLDAMGVPTDRIINHKTWRPGGKTDTLYSDAFWRSRAKAWRVSSFLPPYPGVPMSLGIKGDAVEALQRALGLIPTGEYDLNTLKAVKAFQRARPWLWPADGVAGPKTYAAILGKVK